MRDSKQRFSDRVESYVKYRPSYPPELVKLLQSECGIDKSSVVADIGSGPGNLAALLLPIAKEVVGIEPNREMREAGEQLLADRPNFRSVDGSAEATKLDDRSVDLVTVAQAFHWFDREACRREFQRILRPGGHVALVWNDRLTDVTPFLSAYEALLNECSSDYKAVNHRNIGKQDIAAFFTPCPFKRSSFPYVQNFDWEGLRGRALSSSYVPLTGEEAPVFMSKLEALFHEHQQNGRVAFMYETEVFYGEL